MQMYHEYAQLRLYKEVKDELDSNLPKSVSYTKFVKFVLDEHPEVFLELKSMALNLA